MKLELLQQAPLPIKIHLLFALSAIVIGTYQLIRPKGDRLHRITGIIWVIMMLVISISSFWIKGLYNLAWGYSPIHLISVSVIFQMILGVYYAKTHQIVKHRKMMTYTYFFGLIVTGLFTIVPGRLLYKVLFS
jgi:uncharacterized membrane protein